MAEIRSLFDLAQSIGFDSIDQEIATWIEIGEFDAAVKERAEKLGWVPPHAKLYEQDEGLF